MSYHICNEVYLELYGYKNPTPEFYDGISSEVNWF